MALMRYHRTFHKGQRRPIGLLVAEIDYNNFVCKIGWSRCHEDDNFSKKEARKYAMDRLVQKPITVDFRSGMSENMAVFDSDKFPPQFKRTFSYLLSDIYSQLIRFGTREKEVVATETEVS